MRWVCGIMQPIRRRDILNAHHHTDVRCLAKKGLAFVGKLPGGYPYNEVRLIEINHLHDDDVTAFANTIATSEKHGWVADLNGLKEKAYLYQTIGASLARHWIGQNFHIADVQGADMIKVALPEAYGLLFVEQTLGTDAAELLIKKKMDKYAKDRNNEPNKEPTLICADGAFRQSPGHAQQLRKRCPLTNGGSAWIP